MGKNFAAKQDRFLYVGIDIAAYKADVYLDCKFELKERELQITQDAEGFKTLLGRLKAIGVAPQQVRIVLEATGNYWIDLATILDEADYQVSVVNPRRAHQFMSFLPQRGKSDKIDAQALAKLAAQEQFELWQRPIGLYYEMRDYLMYYDGVVKQTTMLRNQLHALKSKKQRSEEVVSLVENKIKALKQEQKQLVKDLEKLSKKDEEWKETMRLLRTITGVGLMTAAWLIVMTNNFTSCTNVEQLVNYIGLAPLQHESGKSVHKRSRLSKQSNVQIRRALFMAAMTAIRRNPVLKVFYERLTNGKDRQPLAPLAAMIAVMRKLVVIAWAVVHKKVDFRVPASLAS